MINEQELAAAVERLREGDDNGLLINHAQVLLNMHSHQILVPAILVKLFECGNDIQVYFDEKFDEIATDLLREAYRTKLEHEAGL